MVYELGLPERRDLAAPTCLEPSASALSRRASDLPLHGRKGRLVRNSIADSESFRSASQGGRLQSEWVADFRRNRWPDCVGISGRLPSDYATSPTKSSIAVLPFTPDGWRIVTASEDTTAQIWDAHFAMMSAKDLVLEVCTHRLHGLTKLSRDVDAPCGYSDTTPAIDVCAGGE